MTRMVSKMSVKTCTKCGETKPLTEFHKAGHLSSGLRSDCKACSCKRRLDRYHTSAEYRERAKKNNVRRRREMREAMIAAYGGKCACCGETQYEFLAVDHIHNDGAADRAKVGFGLRFYYYLASKGFPKDRYQLLCHNCNQAKAYYGECPHKMANVKTA